VICQICEWLNPRSRLPDDSLWSSQFLFTLLTFWPKPTNSTSPNVSLDTGTVLLSLFQQVSPSMYAALAGIVWLFHFLPHMHMGFQSRKRNSTPESTDPDPGWTPLTNGATVANGTLGICLVLPSVEFLSWTPSLLFFDALLKLEINQNDNLIIMVESYFEVWHLHWVIPN